MQFAQGMPDNRSSEMPNVKGLCNVRRGIIQHHLFAAPEGLRAVPLPFFQNFGDYRAAEIRICDADIQIPARNLDRADRLIRQILLQRSCDLNRRAAQLAAESEAGKGKVAHCGVRRILEHSCDLVRRQRRIGIDLPHARKNPLRNSLFDGLHFNTSSNYNHFINDSRRK